MNSKRIERRIRNLVAAVPEAPVAYQATEVLRHFRATGELRNPDGSRRISLAVYRQIVAIEQRGAQEANSRECPVTGNRFQ
jgi:hypothetical protein